MTYKEAWEEMQRWLVQGAIYLENREKDLAKREEESEYAYVEHIRITGKLDGIQLCIDHMKESEKIYELEEEEENE
jgi:hypothetical protein